jgi:hypothetical protein
MNTDCTHIGELGRTMHSKLQNRRLPVRFLSYLPPGKFWVYVVRNVTASVRPIGLLVTILVTGCQGAT